MVISSEGGGALRQGSETDGPYSYTHTLDPDCSVCIMAAGR